VGTNRYVSGWGKVALSHRRMVADFGFHLGQLAKIENGGAVSAQTMLKLCAAFDMRLEDLVRGLGQD
jgi:DNA-binding Xre family transcriptional regulator